MRVETVEKDEKPSAALENWVSGQNMYRNGKRGSGRLAFAVTQMTSTTHVRSYMILYVAADICRPIQEMWICQNHPAIPGTERTTQRAEKAERVQRARVEKDKVAMVVMEGMAGTHTTES